MTTATSQKQFTGKHMLAILVAFFGVIIAVNLTMAFFANSTWSGLIVKNGYVASQSFGKDLERARTQDALGWTVTMKHAADSVTLTFADRNQQKLAGLTVTGQRRRPAAQVQFDRPADPVEAFAEAVRTGCSLAGYVLA